MKIRIHDVTLRDGSHACQHSFDGTFVAEYCKRADECGIHSLEVGHGNGLGASSLQIGLSAISDWQLLQEARMNLTNTKLAALAIPGWATWKHIKQALEERVDIVRVGCHCSEADTTQKHIENLKMSGKEAHGVLMMAHRLETDELREQAMKMRNYGATEVILMDSAGCFTPDDMKDFQDMPGSGSVVILPMASGFHAHNNLGLAVANALEAARCGAGIIDCSTRGFGAGAGNAPMEQVAVAFERAGIETGLDIDKVIELSEWFETHLPGGWNMPSVEASSLYSARAGVFSGFKVHVIGAAALTGVDEKLIWQELGKRKVVAGQEDMVLDVANELKETKL